MKRMFCLIMAAVLCAGLLTACGGSKGGSDSPKSGEETMESRLIGTWRCVVEPADGEKFELQFVFKTGGAVTTRVISGGESHDKEITWALDDENNLTLGSDDAKNTLMFSEDAREGKIGCWYMDGETFIYQGKEFRKD